MSWNETPGVSRTDGRLGVSRTDGRLCMTRTDGRLCRLLRELDGVQREPAFDHVEGWWSDLWREKADPQIPELQAEIAAKDAQITALQSTIASLNISLKQAENAGQKERIRVDGRRGNLVKRTKYQWILDNTITETLSEEAATYEQGMKYMQDAADAFLKMPLKNIDDRTVDEFEHHTDLGVSLLLNQLRFDYTTKRAWRNGKEISAYALSGPLSILLERADAEKSCKIWTKRLAKGNGTIFVLIERLKKVLTAEELGIMDKVVENVHSFMRLFNVGPAISRHEENKEPAAFAAAQ
jgi:hypothetical protein